MHPRLSWRLVSFSDDVATAAGFRASDEADVIIGQALCIDGGQTAFLEIVLSLRYG